MSVTEDPLDDFDCEAVRVEGTTRDIYRTGAGPAVIVLAEMPGITPKVADFARRVASIGCTAVLPHLFGVPGRSGMRNGRPRLGIMAASLAPACVSRQFRAFALSTTEPISTWLRALATLEHERCGGPGVGAVGMCFTGGFALGMAVEHTMLAPVLSQPSLPIGRGRRGARDLHLSPDDLAAVKQRCATEDLCVLGLRFTHDPLVPAARFETLRRELGDAFISVEIDSSPGNPHGIGRRAHSVLTEHLVDEPGNPTRDALEKVLAFLRDRLVDQPLPS